MHGGYHYAFGPANTVIAPAAAAGRHHLISLLSLQCVMYRSAIVRDPPDACQKTC